MSDIKLTDFVNFNPSRPLKKGIVAPFVEMAALPVDSRDISEIGEREFKGSGSKFKNGDTLFSRITPCLENGKTALVKGLADNEVAHGSTEFIVMSAKEPAFDEDYVYYLARLPEFRAFAKSRMEGTSGRQRVSWQALTEFKFDFPEKKKRKEIGRFLKSIDDKIELNRQTNQTLEQIAQAIFKSWFVDFDPTRAKIAAKQNGQDPERAAMAAISGKTLDELDQRSPEQQAQLKTTAALFPDTLVDSELGEIPEGWKVGTLDNLCQLNKTSWTKKNAPTEVWYVDLANTKNGVIEDIQYYTWEEAPSRAKRVLSQGDTIVGTVRPGNRSFSFVGTMEKQLTASTGFAVLTPSKLEYTEYVFLAATSDENIDRLSHLADGGAYPAVRPDVVTSMTLPIPSEHVLKVFSSLTKPLFEKRDANLIAQATLSELRSSLLPKLLSGELSVEPNQMELEQA